MVKSGCPWYSGITSRNVYTSAYPFGDKRRDVVCVCKNLAVADKQDYCVVHTRALVAVPGVALPAPARVRAGRVGAHRVRVAAVRLARALVYLELQHTH
ncbi:hypothetical protein SFRURICE_014825 [Spodoptera frugiperda]|nr:hypothetical protein SFRURICE_014825 [Spodoptera frugiperda]